MAVDREIGMPMSSAITPSNHRSVLTPACRLPPELLAAIFLRCALDHHRKLGFLTQDVPSWVNVSYVCQYWRGVALDFPTLWTYHFVVSLRWTEELLARSKQALLKVYLNFEYGKPDAWWLGPVERLMNHAERIEELGLHLSDLSTYQILPMLSSSASHLQNLQILGSGLLSEESFVPFHGDTPALRRLNLSDCPVSWYSFKLCALTALDLNGLPLQFRQDTAEFLATLSQMQELTELYLRDALGSTAGFLSSTAFRTFQKFSLPHLARLLISAPFSTVIALLSCVNIPLNTLLRLKCYGEGDSTLDDHILLSSVLSRRFSVSEDQALSSPAIRSLVMDHITSRAVILFFGSWERDCDGSYDSVVVRGERWNCNNPLEITVYWRQPMTSTEDHIMSDICCSIPSTTVQALYVIFPPFSPTFWRKTLGHLYNLRYIKLSQGNMPDLASVLSVIGRTAHGQTENRTGDPMLVPALEELELSRIQFSLEDDCEPPQSAITQRALLDALSTRHLPHGRLTVTRCALGRSGRWDAIRSWDGLINIPVVVQSSGSHSYPQAFLEDDSDDDFESGLESDSEHGLYSDVDSEVYSGAYSGGNSEGELEDESENNLQNDQEDASQGSLEGERGDESEGASESDPGSGELEHDSEDDLDDDPVDEPEDYSAGDSDAGDWGGDPDDDFWDDD